MNPSPYNGNPYSRWGQQPPSDLDRVRRRDQLSTMASKSTQFPPNMPGVRDSYPQLPTTPKGDQGWVQGDIPGVS